MADKQAHETETEFTFEQVRDQLTEAGKSAECSHMKKLQSACPASKSNQTKWMSIMNF